MANPVQEAAPWIERLARVGFVAKGIVHMLIGGLAARAAVGAGGSTTDSSGALMSLLDERWGRFILGAIAVGLFGYALWRILEAVLDTSGRGSEAKGLAIRAGNFGKAVIYGALGVEAARLVIGSGRGSGGRAEHWTGKVLQQPFGQTLVVLVGAGIAVYGIYQLSRAWRAKLSHDLRIGSLPIETRRWVIVVSRFGIAARGVVFCLIGYLAIAAGMNQRASQTGGVEGALDTLGGFGPIALGTIGIGLIAYGLYEFLNARYRKIDVR